MKILYICIEHMQVLELKKSMAYTGVGLQVSSPAVLVILRGEDYEFNQYTQ